jgi:hypothetical protein
MSVGAVVLTGCGSSDKFEPVSKAVEACDGYGEDAVTAINQNGPDMDSVIVTIDVKDGPHLGPLRCVLDSLGTSDSLTEQIVKDVPEDPYASVTTAEEGEEFEDGLTYHWGSLPSEFLLRVTVE